MTENARYTRLETFLKKHAIKPVDLARKSEYSRQHLLRLRKGRMEPTRRCIAALVKACSGILHQPVRASDLFDLGESDGGPRRPTPPF